MTMTIENIPDCRIAYIRQVGPYGPGNVQTMEKLKTWAHSAGLLKEESIILGIAYDAPDTTPPENCRYDACIILPDKYCIKDSINESKLNGGKYAVFKIDHTAEAVQEAWLTIFPELQKENYKLDYSRPILERYKTKLINEHYCEICVPLL